MPNQNFCLLLNEHDYVRVLNIEVVDSTTVLVAKLTGSWQH